MSTWNGKNYGRFSRTQGLLDGMIESSCIFNHNVPTTALSHTNYFLPPLNISALPPSGLGCLQWSQQENMLWEKELDKRLTEEQRLFLGKIPSRNKWSEVNTKAQLSNNITKENKRVLCQITQFESQTSYARKVLGQTLPFSHFIYI